MTKTDNRADKEDRRDEFEESAVVIKKPLNKAQITAASIAVFIAVTATGLVAVGYLAAAVFTPLAVLGIFLAIFFKETSISHLRGLIRLTLALWLAAGFAHIVDNYRNEIARSEMNGVVAAVEKYREANGEYPDRLEQVAPRFIADIPFGKLCIKCGGPVYWRYIAGTQPFLEYRIDARGNHSVYSFELKQWSEPNDMWEALFGN